jgi:hypothetical protein
MSWAASSRGLRDAVKSDAKIKRNDKVQLRLGGSARENDIPTWL